MVAALRASAFVISLVGLLVLTIRPASRAVAAPLDFDIAGGHFFSQTGPGNGEGYRVLDDGRDAAGNAMRFWSEFRRYGAITTLGYPASRRFVGSDGFTYQVFQRGVLQWRPESNAAVLANTFDWFQQAGRDAWLSNLGVPPPVLDDGSGGDWSKARQVRLGWLTEPRIAAALTANPTPTGSQWSIDDAIQFYGLPTSRPERRGPFVVQRFQRIAFQLWVEDVRGMPPAGTVVPVLGGDMLKQAGIVSSDAAVPEPPSGSAAEPGNVRAVYLSYFAAAKDSYRERILDLAAQTEVNGVVLDVKTDYGLTAFPSAVPLARAIGASRPVVDVSALIAQFHRAGLYVIGRHVVFKDPALANARPALAIADARGGVWRDSDGLAWVDPFREEAWDYNVALAKEAARLGIDELQFDFIRFPSANPGDGSRFSRSGSTKDRIAAINGFLARARAELQPLGVKLSADIFGYASWRPEGLAIGQKMDEMARYLDVVSPMLYPSTFSNGIPGYLPGVAYPYEVVSQSVQQARKTLSGTGVIVRPWLQDFPDTSGEHRQYGVAEVASQIRGAREGGAAGWMLWNPWINYTRAAIGPG